MRKRRCHSGEIGHFSFTFFCSSFLNPRKPLSTHW
jgi:hypothetical protein